ncbi:MAG TPA: DegV family protein [Gemmatimonadales bacterium]|nr:DegV family protein [Gemmatimonadales bacterium]
MAAGIAYVDGPRLRRSLLAAADWVAAGRDELNRLNVFPVPDGDTGTNLTLTLREVARALRALDPAPGLPRVTAAAADASIRGARGNSGLLFSQFLLGVREGLGERLRATAADLAGAVRQGFERLRGALEDPVEGTILTVAREAAEEAERARTEGDLRRFMRRVVARAHGALDRTPELLAVLKAAGVVDAGAKGFVRFLEGVRRLMEEGEVAAGAVERPGPDAAAQTAVTPDRDFRFCTEVLVRGPALPGAAALRQALRPLGGSIVVLETRGLVKAHVHTDDPQAVFRLAASWGTVEETKAEDMRAQHAALAARRAVALVTDTACDLPDALVVEHAIGLVPVQLVLGERVYRDRLEMSSEEFFGRLAAGMDATTSQPAPQAFTDAFRDALRGADQVVAVVLSRALSGTCAAAEAAARALGEAGAPGVTVVNSRSASLGQGLLVLRGAELAARGWSPERITAELERVRDQSGGFFTVANFERLVRSGRVGRARAWVGTRLNLKPVMEIARDGAVEPVARVRGAAAVRRRILDLLDAALAPGPRELRLGVVHAGIPEFARALHDELVERYRPKQCLVHPVTPVIAAHAGLGAWGVFYQVEDGTNW